MRIVIEIDGTAVKQMVAGEPALPPPLDALFPVDGGSAPGSEAAAAVADSDGGGPSQDLLDAIGAAERESSDGMPPAEATDAGAGPTQH
jgi:hypothetical protein